MAIGSAIQRGSRVAVYDERGVEIFGRNGELVGYTGSTVSVRNGRSVTTYNERGSSQFTRTS